VDRLLRWRAPIVRGRAHERISRFKFELSLRGQNEYGHKAIFFCGEKRCAIVRPRGWHGVHALKVFWNDWNISIHLK
jgi:hypothetical protein